MKLEFQCGPLGFYLDLLFLQLLSVNESTFPNSGTTLVKDALPYVEAAYNSPYSFFLKGRPQLT